MSGLSAIDKQCPDNAVCPANGGLAVNVNPEPAFGVDYFARFDSKMRMDDFAALGAVKGVCDCAFDDNGVVMDQCEYARCLAYASLLEDKMTCSSNLVKKCAAIKQSPTCANDATLDCFDKDTILTYPPALADECMLSAFRLSDESKSSEMMMAVGFGMLVVLMMAVV